MKASLTALKNLTPLALAIPVSLGLAGSANALTTFTLSPSTPNTPAPNFTQTVDGIGLIVDNGQGTDLPTAGTISGNSNGICAWLSNSASVGGRRCGYTGPGTTVSSVLNSIDFKFDKPIRLVDFNAQTNGVATATLTFGGPVSQSFTINNPGGTFTFPSSIFLPANTPVTLTTSGVTFDPGLDSGALRIKNISVEEVPAPLPVLGAFAAFNSRRRLRQFSKLLAAK